MNALRKKKFFPLHIAFLYLAFASCGKVEDNQGNQTQRSSLSLTGKWQRCTPAPAGSTVPYMTELFNFDAKNVTYAPYADSTCIISTAGNVIVPLTFTIGSNSSAVPGAYDFNYRNGVSGSMIMNGLNVSLPGSGTRYTIVKVDGNQLFIGEPSTSKGGTTEATRHNTLSNAPFIKQ